MKKEKAAAARFISLLLTAALMCGLCGCFRIDVFLADTGTEGIAGEETETEAEEETGDSSDAGISVSGSIPEYIEDYDTSTFYSLCEELTSLAQGTDADAAIKVYEELYDEYLVIYDNSTAAYIAYCVDVTDNSLYESYSDAYNTANDCWDAALIAIKTLTESEFADEFEAYTGETVFEAYAEYEEMTDEERERSQTINDLIDQYNNAIATASEEDTEDYELNMVVGPIYLQLVKLYTEQAKEAGYDNYADYADEVIYMRDYGSEEAAGFREAVKEISSEFFTYYYYFYTYYYYDYSDAVSEEAMDTDDLLDILYEYGEEIDPLVSECAEYLSGSALYTIGSGGNLVSGAFTTQFYSTGTPYIFANTEGYHDLCTLTHEFGHFIDGTVNECPNIFVYGVGSYDIAEIQSNGLQALYSSFYQDIYGEDDGTILQIAQVLDLLYNVVSGCIFDEFQRTIYENPDMSLSEINELYYEISTEYGDPYAAYYSYWWEWVPHNFESPMYYLSYAASAIAAIQIWDESQTDFDSAAADWLSIIEAGTYDCGYMELLENTGLSDFTDQDNVISVCESALDYVYELIIEMDSFDDGSDGIDGGGFGNGSGNISW